MLSSDRSKDNVFVFRLRDLTSPIFLILYEVMFSENLKFLTDHGLVTVEHLREVTHEFYIFCLESIEYLCPFLGQTPRVLSRTNTSSSLV
jgi:hypothetical protein